MKPQTAAFLARSREFLDKANDLFGVHHWSDEAGRAAYLAGLHAAQALIFERTGHTRKRSRPSSGWRFGTVAEAPLNPATPAESLSAVGAAAASDRRHGGLCCGRSTAIKPCA